jgi:hypothetical protein
LIINELKGDRKETEGDRRRQKHFKGDRRRQKENFITI